MIVIPTEEIFAILEKERKTGELLQLDKDFYKNKTGGEKEQDLYGSDKLKENRKRLMEALKARRLQKILTYIAYGRTLPSPIPEEEERLYIRINNIIKEERHGHKAEQIKIISDMPELVTPDGKKIGPFEKGRIINVESDKDMKFLIENKIGERVIQ